MKPAYSRSLPLIALISCSILLSMAGIRWGLPSSLRTALVFPDRAEAERLFPSMIETRNDIYRLSGGSALGRTGSGESPIMASMGIGALGNVLLPNTDSTIAQCARPYFLRTYSTDEQMTLAALSGMNPRRGDLNPRLFQYGGLYIYGMGGVFGLAHITHIVAMSSDLTWYLARPELMGSFFLTGRMVNIIFLAGILMVLWRSALVLYSRRAGYFALLFFAFSPGLVFQAHIMKPYMAGTFFVSLSLLFSARAIMSSNSSRQRDIFLSALSAGLSAAAMPLYCFSILIPILAAVFYRLIPVRKILFIPLIFTGVFFLFNPYWIIDFSHGYHEMLGTRNMYQIPMTFSSAAYFLTQQFPQNFSYSFTILLCIGILFTAITRHRKELFLLSCSLLPLAIFMKLLCGYAASPHSSRFLLPWVLILTLPAARFIDILLESHRNRLVRWTAATTVAVMTVITIAHSAGYSINFLYDTGSLSTRMRAGQWINSHVAPGTVVGITTLPEPSLVPPFAFNRYRLELVRDPLTSDAKYIIVREEQSAFDPDELKQRYTLAERFAPMGFPRWFQARYCPSHVNAAFLLYRKREDISS